MVPYPMLRPRSGEDPLQLPQTTIGTAMVLCHRFYVRRSHAGNDRFVSLQTLFCTSPQKAFVVGSLERTMAPDLIEIEPRELKFTFELKKQSSCTIQLINNTNSYVAFKIKTTSPKRYCVRPNTGVILPKSTCDFTVTMQAQRVAPADMQLRDKFLVQSTIVPYGTTDEDLVPSLFSKETGRQIEESKLRVVLVSPPHSPILQPINKAVKEELTYAAPVFNETPVVSDQELTQDENLHPSHDPKDVDDLKQKLSNLEVKLLEAEKTMSKLREEKNAAVQEKEKLQHDIALLTRKCAARVQVGFPFLFVVFIALVSLALGYRLHP